MRWLLGAVLALGVAFGVGCRAHVKVGPGHHGHHKEWKHEAGHNHDAHCGHYGHGGKVYRWEGNHSHKDGCGHRWDPKVKIWISF